MSRTRRQPVLADTHGTAYLGVRVPAGMVRRIDLLIDRHQVATRSAAVTLALWWWLNRVRTDDEPPPPQGRLEWYG